MSEISPRSMQRYNRRRKIVDRMCNDISYWIGSSAHHGAWTAERIIQFKLDRIYNDLGWAKITQHDQGEVEGWWNCIHRQLWSRLIWTHVLDGERLTSTVNEDRFKDRWCEVNAGADLSYHCYGYRFTPKGSIVGRIIYVPFSQKDRETEFESGRLSPELLSEMLNWARHGHRVEYLTLANMHNRTQLVSVP